MSDDSTDPATDATDDDVTEVDTEAADPEPTQAADTASDAETAAAPQVVRKKVTSKRVTPKGSTQGAKASSSPVSPKARAKADADDHDDDDIGFSKRYTPPKAAYAQGPSPAWVPVLMFGLLIIGALIIMLNYMGVFGSPANIRLVIGLAFILGGIITATQYR